MKWMKKLINKIGKCGRKYFIKVRYIVYLVYIRFFELYRINTYYKRMLFVIFLSEKIFHNWIYEFDSSGNWLRSEW